MVQRFLLDGINAEAAAAAVGREHHLSADALADETKAALAVVELAEARTQAAFDASVRQQRPPAAGVIGFASSWSSCAVLLSEFLDGEPLQAHRLGLADAAFPPREVELLFDAF